MRPQKHEPAGLERIRRYETDDRNLPAFVRRRHRLERTFGAFSNARRLRRAEFAVRSLRVPQGSASGSLPRFCGSVAAISRLKNVDFRTHAQKIPEKVLAHKNDKIQTDKISVWILSIYMLYSKFCSLCLIRRNTNGSGFRIYTLCVLHNLHDFG